MIDLKQKPPSPATLLSDIQDDAYPEGLKIEVSGQQLRDLGFGDTTLPQVNEEFAMHARVRVTEVCKEEGLVESGYCVEFQITAMELQGKDDQGNEQQKAHAQITRMYG